MKELLYNIKKSICYFFRCHFTVNESNSEMQKSWLPDKVYIKKYYKMRLHQELDLKHPRTYNEKLNWLKLYDRRSEYTIMVDKYAVREYIKKQILENDDYSDLGLNFIPLIGVWDKVEDIDFESLPNQFVLKCNHDNGVIICTDKNKLDIKATKRELEYRLNFDYYKKQREWPYKNVNRKIICEQYMYDGGEMLTDYKFFCFNGVVKALYVSTTYNDKLYLDYFDENFTHLEMGRIDHPRINSVIKKNFILPQQFEEMKKIASFLSKGIPHVRVDLYQINGKIYFGEMTFTTAGGVALFEPNEWNYTFGDWIVLPKKRRYCF